MSEEIKTEPVQESSCHRLIDTTDNMHGALVYGLKFLKENPGHFLVLDETNVRDLLTEYRGLRHALKIMGGE